MIFYSFGTYNKPGQYRTLLMQIFIDESKNFLIPSDVKCAVSCVSCLVIPDEDYQAVSSAFDALKADWGVPHIEVKGRDLDEGRIASVVRMLNRYDVIFETIAIDMGLETEVGILNHKNTQADKLMENITSAHRPSLVESVKEAQKQLRLMPNQLYVQTVLMIRLVANILQRASLYYVQRRPNELGRFRWVVDAKDKTVTPSEEFWKNITLPALQTMSLREPLLLLKGADYTSFKPFYGERAKAPEHLGKAAGDDSPFVYTDISKIMADLSFENSEKENGLQLVDILCNAIQRAMNGNLQSHGWEMIGCLTVSAQLGSHVIHLSNLSLESPSVIKGGTVPYTQVVQLVDRLAKPMIL